MKHALTIVALGLAALLSSCGKSEQGQAKETASVLTGDAQGAAADNPLCKLFTAAEASAYAGVTLSAGANAAMGSGCQWADPRPDGDASVLVQSVGASYASPPTLAPTFRKLTDMGDKAYVVSELGGWDAGAPQGDQFVIVSVAGPKASADTAIALLKETLKRKQ